MADETEIIKVAFQGTEMYLRLCGAAIKDALKFLKFLVCAIPNAYRWNQESLSRQYRKEMTKAEWKEIKRQKKKLHSGQVSLDTFLKRYNNSETTILSIPDASSERFADLSKKHNLSYSLLPDLNAADGLFQVMVPVAQAEIYNAILQTLIEQEKIEQEEKKVKLEEELRQIEEDRMKANIEKKQMEQDGRDKTNPEQYKEACNYIDSCNRRISDIEKELAKLDTMYSKEISYTDYMLTNKQAIDHMDLFVDLKDKGVELSGAEKLSEFIKMPTKNETVEDDSIKNKKYKSISFEDSLSTLTKRKEIQEPVIVCDKASPNNYIEVTAGTDVHNERTFIITEFKVFNQGEEQRCDEFKHGKFTHYSDVNAKNSSEAGGEHWENMKKEIKEKGGFSDELLIFKSKEEYHDFLNEREKNKESNIIFGDQYLVNPATPDIAIRRDKIIDEKSQTISHYKYTVMLDGKDSNLTLNMGYHTADSEKMMFLKQTGQEVSRINSDETLKSQWMVFSGNRDFEIYQDSVKKNVRFDQENLKEDFQKAMGKEGVNLTKQMNQESKLQAEQEKIVLNIPSHRILSLQQNKENQVTDAIMYSDDMSYFIRIREKDIHKIKQDNSGNPLILLSNSETLTVTDRISNRDVEQIKDQKSLDDFLNNQGNYPARVKKESLHIGGENHVTKLRKQNS